MSNVVKVIHDVVKFKYKSNPPLRHAYIIEYDTGARCTVYDAPPKKARKYIDGHAYTKQHISYLETPFYTVKRIMRYTKGV